MDFASPQIEYPRFSIAAGTHVGIVKRVQNPVQNTSNYRAISEHQVVTANSHPTARNVPLIHLSKRCYSI